MLFIKTYALTIFSLIIKSLYSIINMWENSLDLYQVLSINKSSITLICDIFNSSAQIAHTPSFNKISFSLFLILILLKIENLELFILLFFHLLYAIFTHLGLYMKLYDFSYYISLNLRFSIVLLSSSVSSKKLYNLFL